MRDVLHETGRWFDDGRPFALATVVRTVGSAPRQPGASIAVGDDGEVVGSISGGCVEGKVHELAQQVLADGLPRLEEYGTSDDDAFAVGPTCGGTLQVLVERVDREAFPAHADVRRAVAGRRAVAVATALDGPVPGSHLVVTADGCSGTLGDEELDGDVTGWALGLLEQGRSAVVRSTALREDEVAVFVEVIVPPPTVFVYGATEFAAALVRAVKLLGYRVVVCDPRAVFATARRFPDADEVVVAWPCEHLAAAEVDERSVVCVLTHDPESDVPLLAVALRSSAAYVGAMGSRAACDDRVARLRALGVEEEALARLCAPIGLDLGARTPAETAVSITAEVLAATRGGTGGRLRGASTPIHR